MVFAVCEMRNLTQQGMKPFSLHCDMWHLFWDLVVECQFHHSQVVMANGSWQKQIMLGCCTVCGKLAQQNALILSVQKCGISWCVHAAASIDAFQKEEVVLLLVHEISESLVQLNISSLNQKS